MQVYEAGTAAPPGNQRDDVLDHPRYVPIVVVSWGNGRLG